MIRCLPGATITMGRLDLVTHKIRRYLREWKGLCVSDVHNIIMGELGPLCGRGSGKGYVGRVESVMCK